MRSWCVRWWMGLLLLALGAGPLLAEERAVVLDLQGAVGPASADYLIRGLERAAEEGAALVVIRVDTPGGLDTSMRAMIKAVLASRVPVIGYVAPSGARAASAGTYLLYATHVAAMAPGTNLGAATPVELIGGTGPGDGARPKQGAEPEGQGTPGNAEAKRSKLVNDAAAYLRSLAELRGRNAEWAERAVREGASLAANEALELRVVELIARDLDDLLRQLDGRRVELPEGAQILHTAGLELVPLPPDWRTELLEVISSPNIAYILMLIGVYGLIYEFANPGAVLPGTVGMIALLLALYAFHLLPVSYAGAGLLLLGIGLMIAEGFVPSFGALGIGGAIAFVIGSLILIDSETPGLAISRPLIFATAASSALVIFTVIHLALRARHAPVVSGREQMIGAPGEALEGFTGRGQVWVHGELWFAESATPLVKGQKIRVTGLDGLLLRVTPEAEPSKRGG